METEKTITALQNHGDPFKPSRSDEAWFEENFGIPWQWAKELLKEGGPLGLEVEYRITKYINDHSEGGEENI